MRPPHIPHIPPASPPVLAIRSRCLALHRPEARGQLLVDSHEPARVGQAAVERGGASERVVVAMHPSGSERFDPAPGLRGGGTGERGMKRRGRVSGLGGGSGSIKACLPVGFPRERGPIPTPPHLLWRVRCQEVGVSP